MRNDKMHPLPWTHKTDGRRMSAVVDAEGKVVCGSLICQQSDGTKARQTHAYIVVSANDKGDTFGQGREGGGAMKLKHTDKELLDWLEANPHEVFTFKEQGGYWRRTWGYKDWRNQFGSFREAVDFAVTDPEKKGKSSKDNDGVDRHERSELVARNGYEAQNKENSE